MPRFLMFPHKNKEAIRVGKQLQAKARRNKKNRRKMSKSSDSSASHHVDYYPRIIYMNQPALISELNTAVTNGDIIELHAHGTPWIIGGEEESTNDYTPYQLAAFFDGVFRLKKDIQITIELRSCNSGTRATGHEGEFEICYARNLSEGLSDYQLDGITVKGYTGYIQSENLFKQSIVAHGSSSRAKFAHCRLEEGEATFKNGILEIPPQKTIVSEFSYLEELEFGESGIQQYFIDRKHFETLRLATSSSSNSSSSTESTSEQDITFDLTASLCFMFDKALNLEKTPELPLLTDDIPSEMECRNHLR